MENRGELTSNQLIAIVILIISFSVILLFFFFLDFKSEIDQNSCRNSVVLRGTAPLGRENVQLACKTINVCITRGEDCEQSGAGTRKIKVNNKEELLDEFSELMYDCWWQMGEGKLNYAPRGFENTYCSMCNTIQVSDSVKSSEFARINMYDLLSVLQNKKTSDGVSYLYSMYQVNTLGAALDRLGTQNSLLEEAQIDLSNPTKYGSEKYALITSITEGADLKTALVAAGAGAASGAYFGPWGVLIGGTGAFTVTFFMTSGDNIHMPPQVYPLNSSVLSNLGCKEFSSSA